MWIVVCVPLMVLAVIVAVVPILVGSIHHREQARRAPLVADSPKAVPPEADPLELSVKCPVCSTSVEGSDDTDLVDAVQRHAWREHGIPSEVHILESVWVA